jgi:SAM-dependent methyltransferase
LEVLSEFQKNYQNGPVNEIKDALLLSESGFIFPVIDGIPRMLLESIYDYQDFLKRHIPDYHQKRKTIEYDYKDLLYNCNRRNKKTKKTFEFEWSFLQPEKRDRIWQNSPEQLTDVLLKETGEKKEFFTGKNIIDIGSGHGLMTAMMAELGNLAIGIEISKAVENAYKRNTRSNAWYLQADLQHLPFAENAFDVLYSSGVIHHTPDTEKSLSLIEPVLKPGGKICLWLYHPQKSKIHNLSLQLRKITRHLPLWLSFPLLQVVVFPVTFLVKYFRRKKAPNYREEMIDLLDTFTPEYRFEVPQETAASWLNSREYKEIQTTSINQFGYSITGSKQAVPQK